MIFANLSKSRESGSSLRNLRTADRKGHLRKEVAKIDKEEFKYAIILNYYQCPVVRNGAENRWEKLNHDLYAGAEIVEMS